MSKNILIAPINWGLGHASRCVIIIKKLIENGYNPIIASDGMSLSFLKNEFPELLSLELPSYHIEYAKVGNNLKWKLIENSPKMIKAIIEENNIVNSWIEKYQLSGIISDNRFGVRSKKIPSVFITHQLNVLSGSTTTLSSKIHQFVIQKYDQCWVPDCEGSMNLSGILGHLDEQNLKVKYIGVLSRLEPEVVPIVNDLLVILSGPEPQRTLLEEKLLKELQSFDGSVLLVQGLVADEQKISQIGNVKIFNYMQSDELGKTINESDLILSRSGYSSIMDLTKLEKRAFFIPTPGQYEQEYLAKKFQTEGKAPYNTQEKFKCEDLKITAAYDVLDCAVNETDWARLFQIFR